MEGELILEMSYFWLVTKIVRQERKIGGNFVPTQTTL
jgi:hypothetical protein